MFAWKPRILRAGGVAAGRKPPRIRRALLIAWLLLSVAPARVSADLPHPALRIYGPGGPHEVLLECAARYRELHGRAVEVLKGGPGRLDRLASQDGDLYYGGAEFMLHDFDRRNPGVLDLRTVELLYPRRVGIIVRKGNPRTIRGLEDLQREGIRVLKASRESMHEYHDGQLEGGRPYIPEPYSGRDALKAWRADQTIDAWITYKSWHAVLAAEADFVELPTDRALRFTPIAIIARTPNRQEAERFIAFLKSPEAGRIFKEHGWE